MVTELSTFMIHLQLIINGVLQGCLYGIAAMGLSLMFGSMRIMFIPLGTVMILGAYTIYWLTRSALFDPVFGFILIIPLFLAMGWLIYTGLFKRLITARKNASLLLAFGLMILLENLMAFFWTSDTRIITTDYSTAAIDLGVIHISVARLIVAVVALLTTVTAIWFFKRTMLGKAIRGVMENTGISTLLGINPVRISAISFSLGIGLSGIAGVATSIVYPFDPFFGFSFSLKALIALAIGGMGTIVAAMVGGIILGVLESVSTYLISASWADVVSYGVFLLILVLKPGGLMGIKSIREV